MLSTDESRLESMFYDPRDDHKAKEFLQCTLDALTSGIAILDETGTIIAANEIWKTYASGKDNTGMITNVGENYLDACRIACDSETEAAAMVTQGIEDILAHRRDDFSLEIPCPGPQEERWFILRITRFNWKGPMRLVVAQEEITDRKLFEIMLSRLNHELQLQARRDPMTQLANRLQLNEDLEALFNQVQRYGHSFCLAFLDIDYFKLYNDRYGHLAGDEVLKTVADTIAHESRLSDRTYRYGGEEFLIILPEQTLESAAHTMDRIRKAVEDRQMPHDARTPPGIVTASVGIAQLLPGSHETIEQLLKEADDALYKAKETGRNRVVVSGGK